MIFFAGAVALLLFISLINSEGAETRELRGISLIEGLSPAVRFRQAECVYIGQSSNVHRRLKQYADFGAGKPVGHYGGRLIWQLADRADLLVAWMATPGSAPPVAERQMINRFRATYGKPPFCERPTQVRQVIGWSQTCTATG